MQPEQPQVETESAISHISSAQEQAKEDKVRHIVRRQLESIIAATYTALNAHNFDTTQPPWTCFSKTFRNEPNGPAPNLSTYTTHPHLSNTTATGLSSLLHFFATLSSTCPSYHTVVVDITATNVDLERGEGEVMCTAESLGIPEGVARPSISCFEFRREGWEWRVVRLRALPGIDLVC